MILTGKNWGGEPDTSHVVIQVVFDETDIQTARDVADRKVGHINVHNPGGIQRLPKVIWNRIVAGKLADAAVGELLRRRIQRSDLTHVIEEYDQSRTDSFQNPDPYDLALITPAGTRETIEVRSSFCYLLAQPSLIIKKLSIYGWYTTTNKPVEVPRDWYWQVVYYLRPRDISVSKNRPNVKIFEDEMERGEIVAYIVGGASRELLLKGATRTDQDNATYQAISPICAGFDYWGMVNSMLGLTLPQMAGCCWSSGTAQSRQ